MAKLFEELIFLLKFISDAVPEIFKGFRPGKEKLR